MIHEGPQVGPSAGPGPGASSRHLNNPGLSWTFPFQVIESDERCHTTYNWRAQKPTPNKTRYIDPSGSDANDGTSPAQAWASPAKAMDEAALDTDINTIICAAGVYRRDWEDATPGNVQHPIAFICQSGRATFSTAQPNLSWVAESPPNDDVYRATRSSVDTVVDRTNLNALGMPTPLAVASDVADCQATPGSWLQSAGDVLVHTWDSRQPDDDVLVQIIVDNCNITNDTTTYFENCDFWGGRAPLDAQCTDDAGAKVVCVNCTFAYSTATSTHLHDNVDFDGVDEAYFLDCITYWSGRDGFNYHHTGAGMKVLEERCTGYQCGRDTSATNQCSSMHDSGSIVRVGGTYTEARAQNIADVGGSESWLVQCTAGGETAFSGPAGQPNYEVQESQMWLHRCTSNDDADRDQDVEQTGVSGDAYTYDLEGNVGSTLGSVSAYDPFGQ